MHEHKLKALVIIRLAQSLDEGPQSAGQLCVDVHVVVRHIVRLQGGLIVAVTLRGALIGQRQNLALLNEAHCPIRHSRVDVFGVALAFNLVRVLLNHLVGPLGRFVFCGSCQVLSQGLLKVHTGIKFQWSVRVQSEGERLCYCHTMASNRHVYVRKPRADSLEDLGNGGVFPLQLVFVRELEAFNDNRAQARLVTEREDPAGFLLGPHHRCSVDQFFYGKVSYSASLFGIRGPLAQESEDKPEVSQGQGPLQQNSVQQNDLQIRGRPQAIAEAESQGPWRFPSLCIPLALQEQ
mmetsp:Transcript_9148/g.26021  ORF Transcript_9148/g.26021 Transcript_9148/m.26021 type:complete len:293 (-) Transcript_9148:941-1819(-)